ncbi:hypothetical protein ATANTOWER_004525 [Ataeniobius toweri]|uniref:Uncharacterized protein n=1 Tax=Ataeniobius toweri TaxID=208326 RepID=A0ABU7C6I3_9TELE|nr:hypothetical protein [Ataeniobius toweri]
MQCSAVGSEHQGLNTLNLHPLSSPKIKELKCYHRGMLAGRGVFWPSVAPLSLLKYRKARGGDGEDGCTPSCLVLIRIFISGLEETRPGKNMEWLCQQLYQDL